MPALKGIIIAALLVLTLFLMVHLLYPAYVV